MPKELLYFINAFGAFPLKQVEKPNVTQFRLSPRLTLWSLTYVTLLSALSALSLLSYLRGMPESMSNFTYVMAVFMDIVPLGVLAVVAGVSNYRHHPRFLEMMRIMGKVDRVLGMKSRWDRARTKVIIVALFTFTTLVVTLVVRTRNTPDYWSKFSYRLSYLVQASLYLQFSHVCHSLAGRFHDFNARLREEVMHNCLRDLSLCVRLPDVNHVSGSRVRPVTSLKTLIDLYSDLCEAVSQANLFYGGQLLVAVFSAFVHNIATLYFFINLFLSGTGHSDFVSELMVQGLWVFTHLTYLLVLILPVTELTKAAEETAPNVCQLMGKAFNSPSVKDQLRTFLIQLYHLRVGFSAMGFFEVDNKILTSIAAAVTTFLAIMIQFHKSNPSSNSYTASSSSDNLYNYN